MKEDQIYDPEYLNKHSNEKVEDSLSVDCEAIINKEAKSKDLASQDEHSTESVVSSLSVVQI